MPHAWWKKPPRIVRSLGCVVTVLIESITFGGSKYLDAAWGGACRNAILAFKLSKKISVLRCCYIFLSLVLMLFLSVLLGRMPVEEISNRYSLRWVLWYCWYCREQTLLRMMHRRLLLLFAVVVVMIARGSDNGRMLIVVVAWVEVCMSAIVIHHAAKRGSWLLLLSFDWCCGWWGCPTQFLG